MSQPYEPLLAILIKLYLRMREDGVPLVDLKDGTYPPDLNEDERRLMYLAGLVKEGIAAKRKAKAQAQTQSQAQDHTGAEDQKDDRDAGDLGPDAPSLAPPPGPGPREAASPDRPGPPIADVATNQPAPDSNTVPAPGDPPGPAPAESDPFDPLPFPAVGGHAPPPVPSPPSPPSPAPNTAPAPAPPVPGPAPQPGGVPAMAKGADGIGEPTPRASEMTKKTIFLKPAKVGEPYDGAIEIDGLKSPRLVDDAGTGLTLDADTGRLTGTPATSGDVQIRLRGLLHARSVEVILNLAVIPDPKSLWVSKPSDRSAPFWKPDEAFMRVDGDLLCVGASKRGRSHAQTGGFRDDDVGLAVTGPGGWHIAAVADGAGSAAYSRRGAAVAVETALAELPPLLDAHVTPDLETLLAMHRDGDERAAGALKRKLYQSLTTAAFGAAKAIEAAAAAQGESPSAFSTTLILCAARRCSESWFFAGFAVGDGGAAVLDAETGSVTPLTAPDSGEFAGQTRFLQSAEFAGGFDAVSHRLFFAIRERCSALVLMTDGITDPKFPTEATFADPARWARFWAEDLTATVDLSRDNPDLERQVLDWLDFWSPGNHDDRTLALMVP